MPFPKENKKNSIELGAVVRSESSYIHGMGTFSYRFFMEYKFEATDNRDWSVFSNIFEKFHFSNVCQNEMWYNPS